MDLLKVAMIRITDPVWIGDEYELMVLLEILRKILDHESLRRVKDTVPNIYNNLSVLIIHSSSRLITK